MWSAATVVVCALDLLGRSAGTMPPINFVREPPPGASRHVEAFVASGSNTIWLVTSSRLFQRIQRSTARCAPSEAVKRLASVIVHEEWHVRRGPDERGAYQAQLMSLLTLGFRPGSAAFDVVQDKIRVLTAEKAGKAPAQKP